VNIEDDQTAKVIVYRWKPGGSSVTGSLTGLVAINSSPVTLSTAGTTDWKHFANNDHKLSGSNSISNWVSIGGTASSYSDDLRNISWTGGSPAATATNNKNGWYISGVNNGFSFTVPAGNGTNTLNVYVGGWNSSGKLTAHLSNSAAPDYVNTTAVAPAQYNAAYTLVYNAVQAGQTLTITWKQASGTGNVTLQGAALTGTAIRVALNEAIANKPTINSINIYPNPATDFVTINFGKMLNNEQADVEVMDLSGKRIYQSGKLSAVPTLQLNTSKYAKGTYIIKITKGVETVNKKLVVE
jgi:Secretion system C-terminal sorting domain